MEFLNNIIKTIEETFPKTTSCSWDFVGLQIKGKHKINKILICLDINNQILKQAIAEKVDLIICHHPLLFANSINCDTISDWKKILYSKVKKSKINVYSLHTNFDKSIFGMNFLMAKDLKLKNINFINDEKLAVSGEFPIAIAPNEFVEIIKTYFNVSKIEIIENNPEKIKKVVLAAGAGGKVISSLTNDIDCFITGEMKWNEIIEANDKKINTIIVGHNMEERFIDFIADFFVSAQFYNLEVIKIHLNISKKFI